MKKIEFSETTLTSNASFSFKEKIEIARCLDRMRADAIEIAPVENERTDTLFVRTASALVKNTTLSIGVGYTEEGVELARTALEKAKKARYRVEVPVSPIQMEFVFHKKPKAALEAIAALVSKCRSYGSDIEFVTVDATRAEAEFLREAIKCAIESGATRVCVCDSAAALLPEDFASFVSALRADVSGLSEIPLGVQASGELGMAESSCVAAFRAGADYVRASVTDKKEPSVEMLSHIIGQKGDEIGVSSNLNTPELTRLAKQIRRIAGGGAHDDGRADRDEAQPEFTMTKNDTVSEVARAVERLGYDLSAEDLSKVYEEFSHTAEKKNITSRELDAIVASVAMQCPPTYVLCSYVTNSGNVIKASATVELERDGKKLQGVSVGDGPIDAAFMAIEQVVGHHYELDDFQIQAVTEGHEAMGQALVKLRSDGKLYSGSGISTDIITASVRAYLNALNKIVYEENDT